VRFRTNGFGASVGPKVHAADRGRLLNVTEKKNIRTAVQRCENFFKKEFLLKKKKDVGRMETRRRRRRESSVRTRRPGFFFFFLTDGSLHLSVA
jgi:hypothetical protein